MSPGQHQLWAFKKSSFRVVDRTWLFAIFQQLFRVQAH